MFCEVAIATIITQNLNREVANECFKRQMELCKTKQGFISTKSRSGPDYSTVLQSLATRLATASDNDP